MNTQTQKGPMCRSSLFTLLRLSIVVVCSATIDCVHITQASGLPEPGLVMYGVVRNTANANAILNTGMLNWTITPPSGAPVTITAQLSQIGGQFSYLVRVPFETLVGSATPSLNVL